MVSHVTLAEVREAVSFGGLETDPLVKLYKFIVHPRTAHLQWIHGSPNWMKTIANLSG